MQPEIKSLQPARRIGLIIADPNPVPINFSSGLMSTTLYWISQGSDSVEVRVGAPDGNLFIQSGGWGCAVTGLWVTNGMTFYLQDVSGGKPLTFENTLSTVTIQAALEPLNLTPDVYTFAAHMAQSLECTHIISIGCHSARQVKQFYPRFEIIGIDTRDNLGDCKKRYPFVKWIEWNLDQPDKMPVEEKILDRSIILCADLVEYLQNPGPLLDRLKDVMNHAPISIFSTSAIDLPIEVHHSKFQSDDSGKKRLHTSELDLLLRSKKFNIVFAGSTASTIIDSEKRGYVAVVEKNQAKTIHGKAPDDFRVVAIMAAYNEDDIIVPSIKYLIEQGICVYLIDNWSTDATYTLAAQLLGKGLIGIEKFPEKAPPSSYDWEAILKRKEVLAGEIKADWFIHYDVDEIRESPWPKLRLKDAIYAVDQAGFNCINHTLIEFHPIDNSFVPGSDFASHFNYFEFGKHPEDFIRINIWKNLGHCISLAETGGHDVRFEQRRIYPYNFLIKHYRIRSQSHGEKKVLKERKARWNPLEKAKGWHKHYDEIGESHSFLRSPFELEIFDENVFNRKYLIERLSGMGVIRAELVVKRKRFDTRNADFEFLNVNLEARNIDLEAINTKFKAYLTEQELFLDTISKKWWVRCIVFINRLLGRKHRLDMRLRSDADH